MGKLQEFDITFANNKVVYNPGETIHGTVKIRISNSLQYKSIKVSCQGSCGVSSKINDLSWTVEEQYVNRTLSVADRGTLAAGEHTFQFQFALPVEIPTSFEGPFGKVFYKIKAAIDTPRFSKDYKAHRIFYMLNMLNLNELPNIEQPSCAVTTKKFSYLLVKTGTLLLKSQSDLRGYIPGQVIKLATEIHNKSGKDTGCVLASLIQKVTYKTKRPVYDLRTIAEVEGAGVKAGKHAEWREQIIVPPLPQSVLDCCRLIDIEYFIQVSLKSPEAIVTLPIYIGNIAFNMSPSSLPSMPSGLDQSGVIPSAPPAEEDLDELDGLCAGGVASEEIPTKSHSQQDATGQPVTMPSSGFHYPLSGPLPPGFMPEPTAPLFCLSTGATIPFFMEGNPTPVPTSCSLILPPEYSSWDYPHEPPPSYEESCPESSLNSGQ
ncbi:arrestin domain-containing protein 1b [Synchiropus splendidus]|uniref:arrestin domain-containing protein 1b n=1 Tax=Synchiropus splendidus TaxID=270530 RepID=UPI00237DE547|nr:arrestin domain-containing protein 1b [Synchiropus splendidus]